MAIKKQSSVVDLIEQQELIQKLKDCGYTDLVESLLSNENKVYTKKGRLNKSGACRVMGVKSKQLEDCLKECREILKREFPDQFDG